MWRLWKLTMLGIPYAGSDRSLPLTDGCSRYIVNWDLRESMTEADIEIILERAKEAHPRIPPVTAISVLTHPTGAGVVRLRKASASPG